MYLYRVDSVRGLAKITDGLFRPILWDDGAAPHERFVTALPTLETGHGIFRMSFWATAEHARTDLRVRQIATPVVLLRVARSAVDKALAGWEEMEDDLIGPHARLFWKAGEVRQAAAPRLSTTGIAVSCFERWDAGNNCWRPGIWPAGR